MRTVRIAHLLVFAIACADPRKVPKEGSAVPAVVDIDSAAWSAMPQLELSKESIVCAPDGERKCPSGELILGASAPDSALAVASRSGSAYVLDRGSSSFRQVAFDGSFWRRTGFGGSLEASGDSAWWLLLPGAPARVLLDDGGEVITRDAAPLRMGDAGTAMRGKLLVRLIVPGARALGDTVDAEFEVIAPSERLGERIATIRRPSTFVLGATGAPLEPFLAASPIWLVLRDERILFCDPSAYELSWHSPDGVGRRLRVEVPRRPVSTDEIERAAALFMSKMPKSDARFLQAVTGDVDRRRRGAPRYHPAVTDLIEDDAMRLWVRGLPSDETDSVRWDVYTPDLAAIGYLVLDGSDRLLVIERERLLVSRMIERSGTKVSWFQLRPSATTTR